MLQIGRTFAEVENGNVPITTSGYNLSLSLARNTLFLLPGHPAPALAHTDSYWKHPSAVEVNEALSYRSHGVRDVEDHVLSGWRTCNETRNGVSHLILAEVQAVLAPRPGKFRLTVGQVDSTRMLAKAT